MLAYQYENRVSCELFPLKLCNLYTIHSIQIALTKIVFCLGMEFAVIITNYNDDIMGSVASQISSLTIVYSAVYSGTHQRKKIKATRH